MKPVLHSAVAVALFLMTAVPGGGQPPQDPTKEPDYFPLAVNTVWTYDAGGTLITVKVTEQKEKKVGDAMEKQYTLETSINNMPVSKEKLAVLKEGICRVAAADKDVNPPLCFLKLPVKKGKKWKVNSSVGDEKITGEFEAGEEEVPAAMIPYFSKGEKDKKVKLVTVKGKGLNINGVPIELTYYFAPDVGLVKQVATVAGVQVDLKLKSLDLPK
jgi:hypothetical protein